MKTLRNIVLGILITMLAACSVKFEVGYHGETAIDDRNFTSASHKAASTNKY